ncbi:bifunctional hydroxymethylpyrimidine kinase/phosphomethylpyrimidine kinase [Vaginisenegalia massiliensis]|uniref:bifunctional hydroxymethylpyrimidine kinase/phosphomethylpyrimidine kinase n=1 Tax=Vaginisenegalia massiliensis TaxID=2058294 RepID=UPI000F542814|nr:bifunctional hydroxymethylpyrimidine kinase/phosphomethylpyrimidine kinase [Vaginisenegalia massiliensis]
MKQVLLVNDWPGVGRVAAKINWPVLSAANFSTTLLPTVILSGHTGLPFPVSRHFLAEDFEQFLCDWQENGYRFDACLTGYFADADQVSCFNSYLNAEAPMSVIVDPIMGDDGHLYTGFDLTYVEVMKGLVAKADVIMPNVTEAAYLSGYPYSLQSTHSDITKMGQSLLALGCQQAIITGINLVDDSDYIYFALIQAEKPLQLFAQKKRPFHYHGSGDLASSLIAAFYWQGSELEKAIIETIAILDEVFDLPLNQDPDQMKYGLIIEPFIARINSLLTRENDINETRK